MQHSISLSRCRDAAAALSLLISCTLPCLGQSVAAPSCDASKASYRYTKDITAPSLLAVVDNQLEDASKATLSADKSYSFFYVYQNNSCKERACVPNPLIAVKVLKVTSARGPAETFLLREGETDKASIRKNLYDAFHTDSNIKPRGPYVAFNDFHVTYKSPDGRTLYSHLPKARREFYLFDDIPANTSPWLTVMNFQFERHKDSLPQCIRFSIKLNQATSAYIEVVEI